MLERASRLDINAQPKRIEQLLDIGLVVSRNTDIFGMGEPTLGIGKILVFIINETLRNI